MQGARWTHWVMQLLVIQDLVWKMLIWGGSPLFLKWSLFHYIMHELWARMIGDLRFNTLNTWMSHRRPSTFYRRGPVECLLLTGWGTKHWAKCRLPICRGPTRWVISLESQQTITLLERTAWVLVKIMCWVTCKVWGTNKRRAKENCQCGN